MGDSQGILAAVCFQLPDPSLFPPRVSGIPNRPLTHLASFFTHMRVLNSPGPPHGNPPQQYQGSWGSQRLPAGVYGHTVLIMEGK